MARHPYLDDPVSGPFWRGCREGELRYQRCGACARPQFYPRTHCRFCSSSELEWQVSRGEGVVYSFTEVHRGPRRETPAPYILALVDLAEGFRILVRLEGCEAERVELGMAVNIIFVEHRVGLVLPQANPS